MKQTRIQPGRWFGRHKHLLSVTLLLSAAVLLLWGRLLLKNVPRTARAKPDPPTSLRTAEHPDLQHKSDDDSFSIELRHYDQTDPTKGYPMAAKSRGDTPDDELVMEVVRTWARSLVLQATMLEDAPTAMINDRTYHVGDSINGFTITSVRPWGAILRRGEIEIRLKMGQ
jgi:hypothetical protein